MSSLAQHLFLILLWGLVATVALSVITYGSQRLGYSRLSLPFLIGTLFTGERAGATASGLVFYLLGGWLFALVYFFIFDAMGRAGFGLGAAIGAAHGLALLVVVLPVLPHLHPRMASVHEGPAAKRILEPPGFLGLNYGWRTPLSTVVAHALYGAILGGLLPMQ